MTNKKTKNKVTDTDPNNVVDNTNESELVNLKQQLEDVTNNWKRALADYQNLQKRMVEEKEHTIRFANSTLLLRVLEVLDHLQMLEKHLDDAGLKMITKNFAQILESEGVTPVEALNTEFDSTTMDAIDTINGKQNHVVEVAQPGYYLKGKLLRPAKVKVGNGQSSTDA
ncbi:MAG: nucleotide exchange factor GrpE [Patescibacteria group bacterium]